MVEDVSVKKEQAIDCMRVTSSEVHLRLAWSVGRVISLGNANTMENVLFIGTGEVIKKV